MTNVLVPVPAPPALNAWVLEWHDADTGLFRVDRWMRDYSTWPVRIRGCAAREVPSPGRPGDPGGPEAQRVAALLLPPGSPVVLSTSKPDKYGERRLARVFYRPDPPRGPVVEFAEVLIAHQWAAPWNGTGVQPKPPWPRTVDVNPVPTFGYHGPLTL